MRTTRFDLEPKKKYATQNCVTYQFTAIFIPFAKQQRKLKNYFSTAVPVTNSTAFFILMSCSSISSVKTRLICSSGI